MKRILFLVPYLFRIPGSVRSEVVGYFMKRFFRRTPSNHEIIWTSFFYFMLESTVKIVEETGHYRVEIANGNTPLRALIRKGTSSDIFVFFQVFISREYQFLLDFLKNRKFVPQIILDAGANVGYFTLLISREFDQARIVAVEPEPGNVEQLRKNLGMNINHSKWSVIQAGLWTINTRLLIRKEAGLEWSFTVAESNTEESGDCDGVSLRDVMRSASCEYIDLLKLDIEGAEGVLFEDSDFQNLLSHVAIIAMEIHDHLVSREKILGELRKQSFDFMEHGELTVAWNKRIVK